MHLTNNTITATDKPNKSESGQVLIEGPSRNIPILVNGDFSNGTNGWSAYHGIGTVNNGTYIH